MTKINFNHYNANGLLLYKAQVFPILILIKPDSPQLAPHEFLIIHDYASNPTNNTAWLITLSQLSKTPDLYYPQFFADT